MIHNVSQANYDAKKYFICAPFCGTRGLLYRQFCDRNCLKLRKLYSRAKAVVIYAFYENRDTPGLLRATYGWT